MSHRPSPATPARRKTTEACNPCRARKLKCNGLLPCNSCEKSKAECCYDPSTTTNQMTGGLDLLNARVVELERAVFGERTVQPRNAASMSDTGQISNQNLPGVTIHDKERACLAFYGTTSTMVLLMSVTESLKSLRPDGERPNKRQRHSESKSDAVCYDADGAIHDMIYAPETNIKGYTSSSVLAVRNFVADAHFDYFVRNLNDTISVLVPSTLKTIYERFRSESSIPVRGQGLVYPMLALGSLYSETATNDEWTAYYYAEAQRLVGFCLLSANSLVTVQGVMMMAIYAHHTARPTMAYNYLGIAIRMAYSIGLNGNSKNTSEWGIDAQSALRTWWTLYSLESDICLEYGKPLCIRETDAKAPYPEQTLEPGSNISKFSFIVANAKFSRIVRKIIDLISTISEKRHPLESFVGRMMNHQAELMTWRGELPAHLAPRHAITSTGEGQREWGDILWAQRQSFDLELRFNNIMQVIHRPFFADTIFSTPFYSSEMARSVCLGASRETILLSHITLVKDLPTRHWSCYYHRVLASTLLVLASGLGDSSQEQSSTVELCLKSVEIFKRMSSGCPMQAISLVERALAQISVGGLTHKPQSGSPEM